jgi:hypothetical protein
MKLVRVAVLLVLVCAAALPQTKQLGEGVYTNTVGDITLAVDATVAIMKIDSPYLMFMAYMASPNAKSISVGRNDVTLSYNGQDYPMVPLKEVTEKYKGGRDDMGLYRRFGKEMLLFDTMRYYKFPQQGEFFPVPGFGAELAVNEGNFTGEIGFQTKLYFKNPGVKKGDVVTIRVRDRKTPEINADVAVTLK